MQFTVDTCRWHRVQIEIYARPVLFAEKERAIWMLELYNQSAVVFTMYEHDAPRLLFLTV